MNGTESRSMLKQISGFLYRLLRAACALFLAIMVTTVFYQVLARYWLEVATPWAEEVAVYCFIWSVLLGTALGVRDNSHLVCEFLPASLPRPLDRSLDAFAFVMAAVTGIVFLWFGADYARLGMTRLSYSMGFPMFYIYVSMPIAGASMLLFLVERLHTLWKDGSGR